MGQKFLFTHIITIFISLREFARPYVGAYVLGQFRSGKVAK
jgi:hypothetical protein